MIAKNINEVIIRLDEIIAASIENNSRDGYFAALYKRVTCSVAQNIKAGYFEDNKQMEQLDVVFANYYLQAYQDAKMNNNCTPPWAAAFAAAKSWNPMIIHHLLAGMNAHIGLDLGIATAVTAKGSPIQSVQNDFNKINVILNEMIDEVKQELYEMWPLSKFIIRLRMGKVENALASFSMGIARDAAWDVALHYSLLNEIKDQQKYLQSRGRSVAEFSKKLLSPPVWLQIFLVVCRCFEVGTIADKIKKLNH